MYFNAKIIFILEWVHVDQLEGYYSSHGSLGCGLASGDGENLIDKK